MNRQSLALVVVLLLVASGPLTALHALPAPASLDAAAARADFGRVPLAFEPNAGQSDPQVRFLAHSSAGVLFFTPSEVVLALKTPDARAARDMVAPRPVLRVRFVGTGASVALAGDELLPGRVNYFLGNDPAKWRTDLPTYARVTYAELYPGIRLEYAGSGGRLKGTYTVAPGADPARIRWRYEGASSVRLDVEGSLRIALTSPDDSSAGTVIEQAPVAWQDVGGRRVAVSARYDLAADGSAGFALGKYDPALPLVLDPVVVVYSTYLGGTGDDMALDLAVGGSGSAFVTGETTSTDFPLQDPFQNQRGGASDVFVTKFTPSGTALVYSTYLGGSDEEWGGYIAVDAAGNAYVTGETISTDFPLQSAFQGTQSGGWDGFVTKLNGSGAMLVYSTYLGGSADEYGAGIAVDAAGDAYVTGATNSTDFPLQSAFQGTNHGAWDAFVTEFSPSGTSLVYSTYLGGSADDYADAGVALDTMGNAYVAGFTRSTDFPLQSAVQSTCGGCPTHSDAFVTEFGPGGTALVYSTYLGGSGSDRALGIAVSTTRSAYVAGQTDSTDFPLAHPFQTTNHGGFDGFVTMFRPNGTALVYSTYLGGSDGDSVEDITLDGAGNAYVVGGTSSTDFPLKGPFQSIQAGGGDVFVTEFVSSGTALVYSTYLGGSQFDYGAGIKVDAAGATYVSGRTYSTDFPLVSPFQSTCGGCSTTVADAFAAKLRLLPYWLSAPIAFYNSQ